MFTGLVQTIGTVLDNQSCDPGQRLIIKAPLNHISIGESIAVNGVCLTVATDSDGENIHFDVSPETIRVTALARLKTGDYVNIERALVAGSALGGHIVNGHVDTYKTIIEIDKLGHYLQMSVGPFDNSEQMYLIPKGSICLDGVSLTINDVKNDCVQVLLIPETLAQTTLNHKKINDLINIEFDYYARIFAHQIRHYHNELKKI